MVWCFSSCLDYLSVGLDGFLYDFSAKYCHSVQSLFDSEMTITWASKKVLCSCSPRPAVLVSTWPSQKTTVLCQPK
ncbi:hypothetical protein CMV_012625 [Castanea mollissima]|uniref:Uncharacterized protein n=1 Tax=Castanea mollissima TaxID=60419 RepID=A0A8J4RH50_9ROSI|nr:hypothetical protein CMV_012625 [Castanea mollissima]